jgi:hypothetical protein
MVHCAQVLGFRSILLLEERKKKKEKKKLAVFIVASLPPSLFRFLSSPDLPTHYLLEKWVSIVVCTTFVAQVPA